MNETRTTQEGKAMTKDQAIALFRSIDGWDEQQCDLCMMTYNGESGRNDIAANLEFYREHCRYIVRDYFDLSNDDLV
jgi:hypothetical protein